MAIKFPQNQEFSTFPTKFILFRATNRYSPESKKIQIFEWNEPINKVSRSEMVSSPGDKKKVRRQKTQENIPSGRQGFWASPQIPFHQTRRFWIWVFVLSLASFVFLVGENYLMRVIVGTGAEPGGPGFRRQAVVCLKGGKKMFMRKIVLSLRNWLVNGVRPANGGTRGGA